MITAHHAISVFGREREISLLVITETHTETIANNLTTEQHLARGREKKNPKTTTKTTLVHKQNYIAQF